MRGTVRRGWRPFFGAMVVLVAVAMFPAVALADYPSVTMSGDLAAGGNGEGVAASGSNQLVVSVTDSSQGISSVTGTLDGTSVTKTSESDVPCGSTSTGCSGSATWDFSTAPAVGWHTFVGTATNKASHSTSVTHPFAVIGAPTVSGTDVAGQTLTATAASIPGTMPSGASTPWYGYQWESCGPAGTGCVSIPGATNSTYVLTASDVGSEIEVVESATTSAQSTAATETSTATGLVEPGTGPSCTKEWLANGSGSWSTASDWSGDAVPSSSDVVCIRGGYSEGSAVTVGSSATVTELQAQGATVTIDGGAALTVSSTSYESGVGTLNLGASSSSGSISIAGGFGVQTALNWVYGTISGGGTMTLDEPAASSIAPAAGSDSIVLNDVDLVNKGWLDAVCSAMTDTTYSMTLIQGENGAKIDNQAGLEFNVPGGTGASDGCEFQQASGAASTFENDGTIYWSGDDSVDSIDIGWVFDNSSDDAVVNNAQIFLFGGQTAPIGGRWNGSSVELDSGGPYSITDDLADFGSQSAGQADVVVGDTPGSTDGATTALTSFLAGTTTAPSLTVTGGTWTNGWIIANGPLTLGQAGQIETVGNVYNDYSSVVTVNGTVNAASYGNADDGELSVSSGAVFNVYGDTGLSGTETISGGSGSTVDFEGPVNVADTSSITTSGGLVLGGAVTGTGNLTVSVGGPFYEQGGVSITGNLSVTSTDSSDVQISGEVDATGNVSLTTGGRIVDEAEIDATNVTAQGTDGITLDGQMTDETAVSLTSAGNIFITESVFPGTLTLTGGGTTIVNCDTTAECAWVGATTMIVNGEILDNESFLGINTELEAENGSQIINDGGIQADDATFTDTGSGAASEFINTSSGYLQDWDNPSTPDNTVSIPYTGTGSVSAAYDLTDILPSNITGPTITGTAKDGQVLTAGTGTWAGTGLTYSYQWQDCNTSGSSCSNITGATSSTYTQGHSDVGDTIVVLVTGTNSGGSTQAASVATGVVQALTPTNTTTPSITGTAHAGSTLTASNGGWTGSTPLSYTYQWEDCNSSGGSCSNITGATSSTYTLANGDISDTIVVKVTASNTSLPGGSTATASSTATGIVQALTPSNTTAPAITGTAQDGDTLTAGNGTWAGSTPLTYSYQWQDCNSSGGSCSNISGATSSTYTVTSGDETHTIVVQITASNSSLTGGGTATATSDPTGVVISTSVTTYTYDSDGRLTQAATSLGG